MMGRVSVRDRQLRRLVTGGWLPRVALIFLVGVAGASLWVRAEAQAAAPEAPEVEVLSRQATSAFLRGVLNPGKEGEGGTYEFLYKASGTECEGAGHAPESPGLSFGLEHEEVFESLSGLEQDTEYTVCLHTENMKGETTLSSPVTFTTALPPETPETRPASDLTGTSATLNGILNPSEAGESGTYRFLYRASPTECQGEGEQQTSLEPAAGHAKEPVIAHVVELLPTTTYTFCVEARNAAEETALGAPRTLITPAIAPTVSEESVSSLGATEVMLAAKVDPGGAPTTYHVEYGAGTVTTDVGLPASATPLAVRQRIVGLTPSTEYHVHFVAHNTLGTGEGVILTFKTTAGASSASTLPDGRGYELVSSAAFEGEVYDPPAGQTPPASDTYTDRPSFRAAVDGNAVAFAGDPGLVGGNGSSGNGLGNQYLARRGATAGSRGWESQDITPAVAEGETAKEGQLTRFESFSEDLSLAFLRSTGQALANSAKPAGPSNCWVMFSRTAADDRFHALFTSTKTPGSCGNPEGAHAQERFRFAGASADGAQTLFQTSGALTADATEAIGEGSNLYDSINGTPRLLNVLSTGQVTLPATFGGPAMEPLKNPPTFDHILSPDGSQAIWSTIKTVELEGETLQVPKALYVRQNPLQPNSPVNGSGECINPADACTVQLDVGEGEAAGISGGGRFWTASADGTKVLFTDCNRLTSDSTATPTEGCERLTGPFAETAILAGSDLYEYDFAKPVGARLTDLTVDHDPENPLGAEVQGILGASADASRVYFVAGAALDSEANDRNEHPTNRKCERPTTTEAEEAAEERLGRLPSGKGCNLYLWQGGRELKFIGALAAKDDELSQTPLGQRYGDWVPDLGSRTSQATGDGTHLVFESTQHLTGYDSSALTARDPEGGLEVFVYSANSGRLSCTSCSPTGAPPDTSFEAVSPARLQVSSSGTYMPRWIDVQGNRVFFTTGQPLVPQDTNRAQDVYEWEGEGAASCPAQTPSRREEGCVFLLSGGDSGGFSYFVDASASGNDVFITHRGPLGQVGPPDERTHLYDVRVGGGFPQTSLACTGTGCQGVPAAPPLFANPASATFTGAGNFLPEGASNRKQLARRLTAVQIRAKRLTKAIRLCKKKKSKPKRATCEARAGKRYGKAKKTTNATELVAK